MALLQANVSLISILTDETKVKEVEPVNNIVSDNALLPITGPLGVSDGTEEVDSSDPISIYVVRAGDSVSQIADMFDVSVHPILARTT